MKTTNQQVGNPHSRLNRQLRDEILLTYYTTNIFQADDYETAVKFLRETPHLRGVALRREDQTRKWRSREWKSNGPPES